MKIRVRFAFFSSLYAVGQIGLGLLVHPYQTLQSVVQEKVFFWMTFIPTAALAVIWLLWKFVIVPIVRLVFSCHITPVLPCDWLPFLSNWIVFFCVYWQILLLYLFFRFSRAFRK